MIRISINNNNNNKNDSKIENLYNFFLLFKLFISWRNEGREKLTNCIQSTYWEEWQYFAIGPHFQSSKKPTLVLLSKDWEERKRARERESERAGGNKRQWALLLKCDMERETTTHYRGRTNRWSRSWIQTKLIWFAIECLSWKNRSGSTTKRISHKRDIFEPNEINGDIRCV